MRILYYYLCLAVVFCLAALSEARCQTIQNVRSTFDGEKMVITYDLIYDDLTQKFNVTFYSSHDNYARPLTLLIGDFGEKVMPGVGNRVTWDAKSSLPQDFDGEINIEVKAVKVAAAPAAVKLSMRPFDQSVYKKGRTIEIRWVGGNPGDKLNLELFRNGIASYKIAERLDNSQHYSWTMPTGVGAGKQYMIRLSNAANSTDLSNSQIFEIKPKTPLIVKVLPFLAVGGAVLLLKPKPDPTPSDLPVPPDPN